MSADDLCDSLRAAVSAGSERTSDFDLDPRPDAPEGRLRPAAVLIALFPDRRQPGLLLTRRSSALRHHPGQIAFPGGKLDEQDGSAEAASLREAEEEVGLSPDKVEILGSLSPHHTVTGFSITPVLAIVRDDFIPIPNYEEVAEVFFVPFAHVIDLERYSVQSRAWRGRRRHYYAVPWGPYYIWGATARILRVLAERVAQ